MSALTDLELVAFASLALSSLAPASIAFASLALASLAIAARTSRRLMTYMDKYSEKSAPSDRKKTPLEAPNGTQGAQSGTE